MTRWSLIGTLVVLAACGEVQNSVDPDAPVAAIDGATDAPSIQDGALSCVEPLPELTAWWRGENTTDDAVGDLDGSLHGGVKFAAAEVGRGFGLDGVDDYVEVHHEGALYPSGSFAIEAWVEAERGSEGVIAEMYAGGGAAWDGNSLVELSLNADHEIYFFVRPRKRPDGINPAGESITSSASLTDGTLHHLVAVRDEEQGQLILYLDGEQDSAVSLTDAALGPLGIEPTTTPDDDPLTIGARFDYRQTTPSGFFSGVIDELSLYTTAIDGAEVAALYGAGSLGKCVPR